MRKGMLMIILGTFLLLRTVNQDATGRTLIDRMLGKKTSSPTAALNAPNTAPSAAQLLNTPSTRAPASTTRITAGAAAANTASAAAATLARAAAGAATVHVHTVRR